jgi:hypothetical protein
MMLLGNTPSHLPPPLPDMLQPPHTHRYEDNFDPVNVAILSLPHFLRRSQKHMCSLTHSHPPPPLLHKPPQVRGQL